MKTTVCQAVILLALLWHAGPLLSQELIIFPKNGQSQQQIEKDKFACYSWAKAQSGFDPMQPPQASSPPPQQQAQDQWEQNQAQAYYQKRDIYNRAYGACLEAKGYTVK